MPPTDGASHAGAYRRYARVYDLVWSAAPYHRFVDLCLAAAAAHGTEVRRVLVAACGTANAAVELAGRGYRVAGFDLSPAMLARAAAAVAGHPGRAGPRPGPVGDQGRGPLTPCGNCRERGWMDQQAKRQGSPRHVHRAP